jgi:uncharacterized damage-inducible protein DinB
MISLEHVSKQYQLLTEWYLLALDGISDQDGSRTLNDHTNSLEWLAGHLIVGRYRNLARLGSTIAPPKSLDKFINQAAPPPNALAFDSKIKYPSLSDCREEWKVYSLAFREALNKADEKMLKTEISFKVPIGGSTVEDALLFIVEHEAYHIGQMSLIRKSLGYTAMQLTPGKGK